MKKTLLFVLLFAFSYQAARAWWDAGHLLVAVIAYRQLDEQVKTKVDHLTRVLERDYPQVNDFAVTGPWPDDLKEDGVRTYDHWHYTNIPYNPDQIDLPHLPEIDLIWAIEQMKKVLGSARAKDVEKARHLAFLVHFVGDIHQPMHSTSLFSQDRPEGNRGGNDFRLRGKNWRNLHMVWDDACGLTSELNDIRPYGEPKQPLSRSELEKVTAFAEDLMEKYPETAFEEAGLLDTRAWARESHELAVEYGYSGIKAGKKPSNAYLKRGREIAGKQITLAGYRLGNLLNRIFQED